MLDQKLDYAIEEAKQKLKLISLNRWKRQMQQLRTIVKRQKTEGQKSKPLPFAFKEGN